jgi:hypothetical protein
MPDRPSTANPLKANPAGSVDRVSKGPVIPASESDVFPRRTLVALTIFAAILLGLLLWTAIAPDSLLFSLS